MKYQISVSIRTKGFFHNTRRALNKMGFTAYSYSNVTNTFNVLDKKDKADKAAIYRFIFNGTALPEGIFDFLEDNPNISSYTIERRDI